MSPLSLFALKFVNLVKTPPFFKGSRLKNDTQINPPKLLTLRDNEESVCKKPLLGVVLTLLLTPLRGNRVLGLWKRDLSGGRYDMRLGKRVFSKTTIGSGKSVAGRASGEQFMT
jgi:hypothetical protein